ncbi:MAG: hypothetical protein GY720_04100 [bacterium]|nr:hypothetical protein [bacterium]
MTMDLETRVRRANPLVHSEQLEQLFGDGASARLLDDVRMRREGRMTEATRKDQPTTGIAPNAEPARQWRVTRLAHRGHPGVAIAAFFVVVAIGVGLFAALNAGEQAPAAPVEIAETFIDVRSPTDAATAVALLAPGAVIEHGIAGDVEGYEATLDWSLAIGDRRLAIDCTEAVFTGASAAITCAYDYSNAWSQALGVGPFSGNTFDFVIADGQILELRHTVGILNDYSPQVWEVFTGWLTSNHLSDRLTMIRTVSDGTQFPIPTPESIALWDQYTQEFVAEIESSRTP